MSRIGEFYRRNESVFLFALIVVILLIGNTEW